MMKAIGVSQYGAVSNLQAKELPNPSKPTGRDLLIKYYTTPRLKQYPRLIVTFRVKAMSVNPIDTKVRNGTYDDAPGKVE
jgi:NADPH:quinone reductase-like Zn-dependent oxidoreductase